MYNQPDFSAPVDEHPLVAADAQASTTSSVLDRPHDVLGSSEHPAPSGVPDSSMPVGTDISASGKDHRRFEAPLFGGGLLPGDLPEDSCDEDLPSEVGAVANNVAGTGGSGEVGVGGARVSPGGAEMVAALEVLFEGLDVTPVESFPALSDHDLVSAIDDVAAHGFLDALRLRRIADLYWRGCMNPLAPHEMTDDAKAFTGTGTNGQGKRTAKGKGQLKTARVRGGIRALTRNEIVAAEIRALLKLPQQAAARQVQIALALTSRLPHTLNALQRGRLDYRRIQYLEGYFTPLMDDHYRQARRAGRSPADAEKAAAATGRALEGYVFPMIWDAFPSTVHEVCAAAVIMVDPGFVERTRQENVKDRYLSHRRDGDMGEIHARLGAAEAQGVFNVIDAYARLARSQGDERTLEVLRVDAFADLILHGHLPDGTRPAPTGKPTVVPEPDPKTGRVPPMPTPAPDPSEEAATTCPRPETGETGENCYGDGSDENSTLTTSKSTTQAGSCTCTCVGRGVSANVSVVVNLETLLGLDEHPGELAGHGPITATLARSLAFNAGSIWRRMVIDPIHGYVLDFGRTRYQAPKPLSDHVDARDRTCRTPGCTRPAVLCDQDHLVPYPAGSTSESNLCTECRHHHRIKHEGRAFHRVSTDPEDPPGTVAMTTAGGQSFLSHPHDYRPLRPGSLPEFGHDSFAGRSGMGDVGPRTAANRRRMLEWLCLVGPIPDSHTDPNQPDPGPLPF